MANIKKSFNFRNGVQVDDDNLLVTSTGLVAIGKTIPTEALDVIGNVVVSGVTSSVEANICFTSLQVKFGFFSSIKAITPETFGAAEDVPFMVVV